MATAGFSGLTGREKQILDLLVLNLSSKQVALHLGIQSRTVDNHCVKIIRKLGASDRFDAVRSWLRIEASTLYTVLHNNTPLCTDPHRSACRLP